MEQAVKRTGGRRRETLAQFEAAVLKHYDEKKAPYTTFAPVRRVLSILKDDLRVRSCAELERKEIIDRFNEYCTSNNFAESTRWTWLGILGAIVRIGFNLGILRSMPDFPIGPDASKLPRSTRSLPPSEAEFDRFVGHLRREADNSWENHRIYALVSTLARTGITLKGALHLRISEVDRARERILMRMDSRAEAKSKRISPELMEVLSRWLPRSGPDLVFPFKEGGGRWHISGSTTGSPHAEIRAACAAAGVRQITFVQLRRYYVENYVPSLPDAVLRPAPAARGGAAAFVVVLGAPEDQPIVFGELMRPITDGERGAVSALMQAGPDGLTMGELRERLGGKKSGVTTLVRLKRKHPNWDRAILFPGGPYGRYRIATAEAPG